MTFRSLHLPARVCGFKIDTASLPQRGKLAASQTGFSGKKFLQASCCLINALRPSWKLLSRFFFFFFSLWEKNELFSLCYNKMVLNLPQIHSS